MGCMWGIYSIMALYFVLNGLLIYRTYSYLKATPFLAVPLALSGGFLTFSYLLARVIKGDVPEPLTKFLYLAGSFWMVAFVYFFLIWLMIELARLALKFTRHLDNVRSKLPRFFPQKTVFGIILFVSLVICAGYMNNLKPVVRTLTIPIDKALSDRQTLRVVVAADMHLGLIVNGPRAEQFVRLINEQEPDMVLLPGDIIDSSVGDVRVNGGAAALEKIHAPLGVFACLGNHEFYAGEQASFEFLDSLGINVMRDEFINLANGLQIAGRLDVARERFGLSRKPLREIIGAADPRSPMILLDHQPVAIQEAKDAGVDLLVCGHTHNGQFWPFNYVVKWIFDMAYGYAKKGDTHIYVSNGLGSWGPPVRIGRPPELVVLELVFRPPPAIPDEAP